MKARSHHAQEGRFWLHSCERVRHVRVWEVGRGCGDRESEQPHAHRPARPPGGPHGDSQHRPPCNPQNFNRAIASLLGAVKENEGKQ